MPCAVHEGQERAHNLQVAWQGEFGNGTVQWFNLKNDRGEPGDLAESQLAKTRKSLAMLKSWREDVSAEMMSEK